MTDTTIAPSANEAVWHAAGAALYDGDIDRFLAHWQPDGRYEVAYPIAGMPSIVAGHDQLRELFAGFAALTNWVRVADVRFHATVDPDVAFVEERMTAELHDGSALRERPLHARHLPRRAHRGDLRVLRRARARGHAAPPRGGVMSVTGRNPRRAVADHPLLRPGSPSHREGLACRTLTRSW